ncbi:4Fe-4S binding protein [Caldicellulosiruptor morganii]|uniref:4Fe-4S binding protein n=1 Tax=Caldicellulosiruptor morganii TaxID=1387555 RepID=A0ABY7BSM1_9FIRM|nr:4Fe-4S binding protein [Caldicellulosiruptor morganii]WAM34629.1 4Fe-4S binding protein [Caldicellulosiruptor morganii]
MKKAVLDKNLCDRSPFCPASRSCRFDAIKRKVYGFFDVEIEIDKEKCTGCGVCVRYCPQGAIELVEE